MTPDQVARMFRHAATEAMTPGHLTREEMALRRVLHSLAQGATEIARETRVAPSSLDDLGLTYLQDRPEPGHARARLELVTGGGTVTLDFADITTTTMGDGTVRATGTDSAGTWEGAADSTGGAVLAMLAERCGHHADITFLEEDPER